MNTAGSHSIFQEKAEIPIMNSPNHSNSIRQVETTIRWWQSNRRMVQRHVREDIHIKNDILSYPCETFSHRCDTENNT